MAEHDKRDQPLQMATAGASDDAAPFVDDIVIWVGGSPDERPRKLTREALAKLPQIDEKLMPPINDLIKQGVVIAAIPTTSGIGAACYLVNLTTLKKP